MSKNNFLFPITLGLSDGIITALMLAAGDLLSHNDVGLNLALRIAFGSAFVGSFSYFIAEYARLRGELYRASRQLTLKSPSFLTRGKLGKEIIIESTLGTSLSGACGFAGALIPLLVNVYIPQPVWLSIITANVTLGVLGLGLSRTVLGKHIYWAIAMVVMGIVVTVAGSILHIVG